MSNIGFKLSAAFTVLLLTQSAGGDVPIYHKTQKGERAQFIIKTAMLNSVIYEVFPDGEYFLAKENQRFVCHAPDFYEAAAD